LPVVVNWLARAEVKNRFTRIELLTVKENTGVSANCNRIINAATSEWIKFIAGDDILLPNCIADNRAFAEKNPEAKVIFSQVKLYKEKFTGSAYIRDIPANYPDNLMHPELTAKDQFELLLLADRINYTPSYFFSKQAVLAVGGYEEHHTGIEDYPMWLKLTKAGYRLHYFHHPTVGYRMHANALNNNAWQGTVRPDYNKIHQMRQQVAHPYLPWEIAARENFAFYVARIVTFFNLHQRTGMVKKAYRFIIHYLNPFNYLYHIKKRLPGSHRASHFY